MSARSAGRHSVLTGWLNGLFGRQLRKGGRLAEAGKKTELEKRWGKEGHAQERAGKSMKQALGGEKS